MNEHVFNHCQFINKHLTLHLSPKRELFAIVEKKPGEFFAGMERRNRRTPAKPGYQRSTAHSAYAGLTK